MAPEICFDIWIDKTSHTQLFDIYFLSGLILKKLLHTGNSLKVLLLFAASVFPVSHSP